MNERTKPFFMWSVGELLAIQNQEEEMDVNYLQLKVHELPALKAAIAEWEARHV